MKPINVFSSGLVFSPDSRRVIVRPFISSDVTSVLHILERAFALSEEAMEAQFALLCAGFSSRHADLESAWRRHFALVQHHVGERAISEIRKLYIGALFSGEYAIESAALFNPSMVPHPDQTGVEPGALRFVMSLRATGEGHISSIEFRSGLLDSDGSIDVDEVSRLVVAPEVVRNPTYLKHVFVDKLNEMGFQNPWATQVMDSLGNTFTHEELGRSLGDLSAGDGSREVDRTRECIDWLARSNYEIHFPASVPLSQRIIFPVSANESNGIEDARFVRFCDDDGSVCYYATYTAFNGHAILPQFIETKDFLSFRVRTLNGRAVQNKGMALFPRKIDGKFAMISRQDDENLFLMLSDNLHFWSEPQLLMQPENPWEFVKIGNCGSPIETEHGWLVITHGVGPMRRYCIGAMLLDLTNPGTVLARLALPLIEPSDEEREGYVPNVVYSCGSLLHGRRLLLPYALSDSRSTIGWVDLDELLNALTSRVE